MRKNTYRLSAHPSSFYLNTFDDRDLRIDAGGRTAFTRVGQGDLMFEVHLPVEFGETRSDLTPVARSVLSQVVEMDAAARAIEHEFEDDEELAAVTVHEFFVEFRYWSTTVNSQWDVYFTPAQDGLWRHGGVELLWRRGEKKKPTILAVDAAYGETHSAAAGVHLSCGRSWARSRIGA